MLAIWFMNGLQVLPQSNLLGVMPATWSVAETGDFNGDHMTDILWRDTSAGTVAIWFMNGLALSPQTVGTVTTDWTIQGANAD
jgi:hypothetical protein